MDKYEVTIKKNGREIRNVEFVMDDEMIIPTPNTHSFYKDTLFYVAKNDQILDHTIKKSYPGLDIYR